MKRLIRIVFLRCVWRALLRLRGGRPPRSSMPVAAFLAGRIGFLDIAMIVEDVLDRYSAGRPNTIGDVLAADAQARLFAGQTMERLTV